MVRGKREMKNGWLYSVTVVLLVGLLLLVVTHLGFSARDKQIYFEGSEYRLLEGRELENAITDKTIIGNVGAEHFIGVNKYQFDGLGPQEGRYYIILDGVCTKTCDHGEDKCSKLNCEAIYKNNKDEYIAVKAPLEAKMPPITYKITIKDRKAL